MYPLIKPILFHLDPECAHSLAMKALGLMPAFCFKAKSAHAVSALGLEFAHPLGLAAGFDKNGRYLKQLEKLGFSFIEVGTVTPLAQPGNPKPRLFRFPQEEALLNRMGFNNEGVDALIENIKSSDYQGVLGINIGKNKATALNRAVEDYLYCYQKVYPYANYVTLNISSPNTPELRLLQQEGYLSTLLTALTEAQAKWAAYYQRFVPLVVKISPDESDEALKRIASLCLEKKISGLIATNTTCDYSGVKALEGKKDEGGVSGRPLFEKSTHCLRLLKAELGESISLIAVGGIDSLATARAKIEAGASLVQIYTGFIYKGPALIRQLVEQL